MTTFLFIVISILLLAAGAAGATTPPPPPSLSPPSPLPRPPPPPPPRKAAHSPPRSPPPAAGAAAAPANCSEELVSFSKCLPYTSSSPNNATNLPSRQCCSDVASAFASGNGVCFCYLVQKPNLLGFPINSTRVLSLSSVCPMRYHEIKANSSLASLCSRTHTLPPLKSITSPGQSQPRISGPLNPSPANPSPVNPSPLNLPPPPSVNFTQDSQDSNAGTNIPSPAYSETPAPADSDTPATADSDTPAPPDGSHAVPRLPLIPAWRTFPISGINSKSSWLLPLVMVVVGVVVRVLT